MKFSMTGQEKGDTGGCLIEVTAWTGLTVFVCWLIWYEMYHEWKEYLEFCILKKENLLKIQKQINKEDARIKLHFNQVENQQNLLIKNKYYLFTSNIHPHKCIWLNYSPEYAKNGLKKKKKKWKKKKSWSVFGKKSSR